MARTRASQAASAAFGKVGTVTVPRDAGGDGPAVDTPEAPPVPQEPAQAVAGRDADRAATPPAKPAISKARLQDHIFALDSAFGKLRATSDDYRDALERVERVVTEARRDEVDEDIITSAAKRKGMDVPEGS
jgi:hypothetical protein